MKRISFFSLLALIALVMSSCKYEEGPFISFIPKVERVTNTWIAEKSIVNGTEQAGLDGFKEVTFYKEGNCNYVQDAGAFGDINYNGTWSFSTDKASILLNLNSGVLSYEDSWDILRLKEEEMWVKFTDGNDNVEVFLTPKP